MLIRWTLVGCCKMGSDWIVSHMLAEVIRLLDTEEEIGLESTIDRFGKWLDCFSIRLCRQSLWLNRSRRRDAGQYRFILHVSVGHIILRITIFYLYITLTLRIYLYIDDGITCCTKPGRANPSRRPSAFRRARSGVVQPGRAQHPKGPGRPLGTTQKSSKTWRK